MLYDLLSRDRASGLGGGLLPGTRLLPVSFLPAGKRVQDWIGLKDAIERSLCSGIFIDSKFYAPLISAQPNTPPNLQPLYFCSFVNPAVVQKLNSGTALHLYLTN